MRPKRKGFALFWTNAVDLASAFANIEKHAAKIIWPDFHLGQTPASGLTDDIILHKKVNRHTQVLSNVLNLLMVDPNIAAFPNATVACARLTGFGIKRKIPPFFSHWFGIGHN